MKTTGRQLQQLMNEIMLLEKNADRILAKVHQRASDGGDAVREELLNEDVRRRDGKWCAYVDDKLTKAEKEANPKRHKGKAVGAVQRTPDGKIRMKARACYASKKKANNAMAAAMMEGTEDTSLDQLLEEIAEVEALLEDRKPPPGTLWKNIRNRKKAGNAGSNQARKDTR